MTCVCMLLKHSVACQVASYQSIHQTLVRQNHHLSQVCEIFCVLQKIQLQIP